MSEVNKAAEEGELLVEAKELSEKLRRHHADDLWDWDDLLYAADMIDKFATDFGSRHIANSGKVKPFGYFHELLNVDGSGKGIWLGCDSEQDTKNSHIDGETGGAVIALYATPPATTGASTAPRPTDDELWDATLRDRDAYHDWADKLADAIANYFGVDIGEHSNQNLPWDEALQAIENAEPVGASTVLTDERIGETVTMKRSEYLADRDACFQRGKEHGQKLVAAQAGQNCFLSWGGKNVHGDEASIKAVKAALHDAGTVPELKDRIRDLQAQAGQVAVPEGWTLVPVEPTDDMRQACRYLAYADHIDDEWAYMLAAVPSPAKESK